MDPYVHSEVATCIRDSEGTFAERRAKLHRSLQRSLKVTKGELMQRNIVQSVNVIRRGSRALEGLVGSRPPLGDMVAAKRLPPDYIDQAFPTKAENSVAPLADRIERVSLQRALQQPQHPGRRSTWQPGQHDFPSANSSALLNTGAPASSSGGMAAPPQMDPAMLAAMVVQVAMMSGDKRPHSPPVMPGQPWLGQAPMSQGQVPPWQPMAAAQMQRPPATVPAAALMGRKEPASVAAAVPATIATTEQPQPLAGVQAAVQAPSATPVAVGADAPPKPKPQRRPDSSGARPQRPAFLRLLDEFCDKALAKEASTGGPTAASTH